MQRLFSFIFNACRWWWTTFQLVVALTSVDGVVIKLEVVNLYIFLLCERDRERQRQRETERDRDRDRETERETDRQRQREIDRLDRYRYTTVSKNKYLKFY